MEIREATDADWPAIYRFFAEIVKAGETYTYPELDSSAAKAQWMTPPPSRTVVAIDGDEILGSARMGPNRPARGSHLANASFMVDPARKGMGTGRALGEHVVEWARTSGYRGLVFNAVVETNTPAIRLWQSLGLEIVGTVPGAFEHPTHGFVALHVMHRPL